MITTHAPAAAAGTTRSDVALRVALTVNALVAAAGLAVKFGYAATTADPQFPTVFGRVANELCYFTIQSNIIVVAVCAALAWGGERWRRVAGTPRLVALVCITITAIVYYALLAADEHFVGLARVGDVLAHLVSPVLYVGTWLVLGPRGFLRRSSVVGMLAFPAFWVALTLARGAVIDYYPYDFVDVRANGYVSVAVTIVGLTLAAVAMAAAAVWFDRRRVRIPGAAT